MTPVIILLILMNIFLIIIAYRQEQFYKTHKRLLNERDKYLQTTIKLSKSSLDETYK